jgi:hypothetical protein
LASPIPAPRLLDNPITPTITPSNDVVAPRTRTPISRTKYHVPSTTPPQVPTERAPTVILHGPRDLSGLRSSTPDPWGTLSRRRRIHSYPPRDLSAPRSDAPNPWRSPRRRHNGQHAHVPRQFTRQRQHPPIYPANKYLHTTPIPKPPAPASTHVFETVTHPHGIGPSKPVIRVPTLMTGHAPTHPAQHMDRAIVKSETPLPLSHSTTTIRCQCGQLVRASDALQTRNIPLYHTLQTFISNIFSPFSSPSLFFSHLRFS